MIGNMCAFLPGKYRTARFAIVFSLCCMALPLSSVSAQTVDRIIAVINGNKNHNPV